MPVNIVSVELYANSKTVIKDLPSGGNMTENNVTALKFIFDSAWDTFTNHKLRVITPARVKRPEREPDIGTMDQFTLGRDDLDAQGKLFFQVTGTSESGEILLSDLSHIIVKQSINGLIGGAITPYIDILASCQSARDDANASKIAADEATVQVLESIEGATATAVTLCSDQVTIATTQAGISTTKAEQATQAYSDFISTIGTSVPNLTDGKIPMSQIPATATQEIYIISSESELTSLVAQKGDLAEIVQTVNEVPTVTKTYQLSASDATVLSNWIVWGTSYAVQAGSATMADSATNASMINNTRINVYNSLSEYESATPETGTICFVKAGV